MVNAKQNRSRSGFGKAGIWRLDHMAVLRAMTVAEGFNDSHPNSQKSGQGGWPTRPIGHLKSGIGSAGGGRPVS